MIKEIVAFVKKNLHTSIVILQKPTVDSLQKLTNTLHTFGPHFF